MVMVMATAQSEAHRLKRFPCRLKQKNGTLGAVFFVFQRCQHLGFDSNQAVVLAFVAYIAIN